MNKIFKVMTIACAISLLSTSVSYAKVTRLWTGSDASYVESKHGDSYFADKYYGTVSVRGSDRVINKGRYCYFSEVRLTYNVQGKNYIVAARPTSKNSNRPVVKKIEVKDKWNNGPKTTATYSINYAPVDGSTVNSVGNEVDTFISRNIVVE